MNSNHNSSPGTVVTVIIIITAVAIAVVLLEGISSIGTGIYHATQGHKSYHSYDEVIGWTGRRNTYYPDYFGPDKYIRINSQGFREDTDTPVEDPHGKARIICSGNSFTFGQGVSNTETWCRQLSDFLPNIETVNLGQSGYGVDQSYLWYLKAGSHIQHRIHVFAFIDADLDRMAVTSNWDTGKPVLRLSGNDIEISNVPVPWFRHWLARKTREADLRVVNLGSKILSSLINPASPGPHEITPEATGKVARRVFEKLVESGTHAGQETLFVYLPTERDVRGDIHWRNWTGKVLTELQYHFIDLTPAMRKLPAGRVAGFFIDGGDDDGHYTYEGNRWVAEKLSRVLTKDFKSALLPAGDNK